MTELTQAQLAKELGFWPTTAQGWTWTWQRCGRYEYRKRLTHSTNPDHLIPSETSPTVGRHYRRQHGMRLASLDPFSLHD